MVWVSLSLDDELVSIGVEVVWGGWQGEVVFVVNFSEMTCAVVVLMDFVAYAGAAAMLWINREFLMLHGTNGNAVTLPIATAIFVVTINFVRGLLIAARFLTAYACKGYTASCALAAACVALGALGVQSVTSHPGPVS